MEKIILKKYQYSLATGTYDLIKEVEVNEQVADCVNAYFAKLPLEIPQFYKWELKYTHCNKVISKLIAVSELLVHIEKRAAEAVPKKAMPISVIDRLIDDIIDERQRSINKFGLQNRTPIEWMAILMEEVGEASQVAVNISLLGLNKSTWLDFELEMIQVATVALNALECLHRNQLK